MFDPPDLTGYVLFEVRMFDADVPKDDVEESLVELFRNDEGLKLGRISTNGIVWAWLRRSIGSSDINTNHVIIDTDGDGLFNLRVGMREEISRPQHVK